MSTRLKSIAGALLTMTLVLAAAPAWAHEEIAPATVATGQPTFMTLLSANETRSALNKLTLTAPSGVTLGAATRQPEGWTAEKSERAITWTGGSVAPGSFEEWGFEIEPVDQPGELRFRVASAFASGSTDTHTVIVTAGAGGASSPATSEPTVTVGTAPEGEDDTTTSSDAAAAPASSGDGSDSSGRANVAMGLAGAALLLSLVALVAALRSARGHGGPTAPEARDW